MYHVYSLGDKCLKIPHFEGAVVPVCGAEGPHPHHINTYLLNLHMLHVHVHCTYAYTCESSNCGTQHGIIGTLAWAAAVVTNL